MRERDSMGVEAGTHMPPMGSLKTVRLQRGAAGLAGGLGRLGVPAFEWAAFALIVLLAAVARFVNLPARGMWDSDQGFELGAIWNAVQTHQLPAYGSPAFTTGPAFHHGALFYDLLIPISWISHGNPTAMVVEIALFGLAVVPLVWWTARSIGGTSAGLAAALLAAVSPALIDNSTFLWNPTLVEPGAALACFGAWQAWRTRDARWWVVAAAGTALASQSHLTGLVLLFPMAALFLVDLRRGPAKTRSRLAAWGIAGVGLFVLTWLPWILNEVGRGFVETRAMLQFSQDGPPALDPLSRLFIGFTRVLAYPFTTWPLNGVLAGLPAALAAATAIVAGMIWRLTGVFVRRRDGSAVVDGSSLERQGLTFVVGAIVLMTTILALVIRAVSQFSDLNQEQYHSVVDVFAILAAGLLVSGLWRARPLKRRPNSGRAVAVVVLTCLVAVGVANWPPLTAADGGWPAAQSAAQRLENDASGRDVALVALPTFIPGDAYGYPLKLDGYRLVDPAGSGTLIVLCYPSWAHKWSLGDCGGAAEAAWIASNLSGRRYSRVDEWQPAPDRVLSVYRLSR